MNEDHLVSFLFDHVDDLFPDYFDRLEDAFFFDPHKISAENSPIGKLTADIFKEINLTSRKKLKEKKTFLNCLLTNLSCSFRRNLPVAIPCGRNYFNFDKSYGLTHYTYVITKQIKKALESLEYIQHKNGFYNKSNGKGRFTRLQPSEKLKRIFAVITQKEFLLIYSNEDFYFIDPLKADKKELTRPIILKAEKKSIHRHKSKRKKRKQKEYPINYRLDSNINPKIKFLDKYNQFIPDAEILFSIDENFVLRIKDEQKNKNTLIFIEKLKTLLQSIQLLNTEHLKQLISLINLIQQTSQTQVPTPLLRLYQGKYYLFSKLSGIMHRIYHRGSFEKGGRFFGPEYQSFNEEQRSKILINGEPTIELDYGGYHLRMLYHKDGSEYHGDPYDVFNGNEELRKLMKKVSLICVNATTEGQAINGINQLFYEDKKIKSITSKYELITKDLINIFKAFHKPIEKYFFSDKGVELMYIDSLIAEDILKHFFNKKIPCLCIHDSFIVQEKYKYELYQVMREKYFKHLRGFYPVIKPELCEGK